MQEFDLIPDGWHELSGFCDCVIDDEYSGEDINALIVQVDGKNYLCYEDPDDGYRSHSEFQETDKPCTNTFPPQRVMVKTYDQGSHGYKDHGVKFFNPDFELILHIGTENYDDYYPMAVWEWHPENLPINKGVHKPEYAMPGELTMKVKECIFSEPMAATDMLDIIDKYYKEAYTNGKMETVKRMEKCFEFFKIDDKYVQLSKYVDIVFDIVKVIREIDPSFMPKEH